MTAAVKTFNIIKARRRSAVILQARLDSTRLPRKAMLPLGGKPMVARVMEALRKVKVAAYILACPQDSKTEFEPLAEEAGFEIFAGPKEDVLARYCEAIRFFSLARFPDSRIIRATGDNPFVFADAADKINTEGFTLGADYAAFAGLPLGAGVESVKVCALLRAEREAASAYEREHVCPYLYNHPEIFSLHRPLAPKKWRNPGLRLTVDTPEDYERAKMFLN